MRHIPAQSCLAGAAKTSRTDSVTRPFAAVRILNGDAIVIVRDGGYYQNPTTSAITGGTAVLLRINRDQTALIEHGQPVGDVECALQGVSHDENRHPEATFQEENHLIQARRDDRVESRGRFV